MTKQRFRRTRTGEKSTGHIYVNSFVCVETRNKLHALAVFSNLTVTALSGLILDEYVESQEFKDKMRNSLES